MKFETNEQKASYGIGRQMGEQLASNPFEGLDIVAVQEGLASAFIGEPSVVDPQEMNAAFEAIAKVMQAQKAEQAKAAAAEGEAYLQQNAARDEVNTTDSGLQYEVLSEGTGAKPAADSTVRVHYHGTFTDGRVFDSSVERGEPAEFPVNGVIAGWTEALQMMTAGSRWKLYIPHHLAYGERGAGGAIPPYCALVFEVELLDVL